MQNLESEGPRQITGSSAPSSSWPADGQITFQNVEMRYRDDLPLVLKNLCFSILPEETIGIVGRTGSGILVYFTVLFCLMLVLCLSLSVLRVVLLVEEISCDTGWLFLQGNLHWASHSSD